MRIFIYTLPKRNVGRPVEPNISLKNKNKQTKKQFAIKVEILYSMKRFTSMQF